MAKRKLENRDNPDALEGSERKRAHSVQSDAQENKEKTEKEPDLNAVVQSVVSGLYKNASDVVPKEEKNAEDVATVNGNGDGQQKYQVIVSEEAKKAHGDDSPPVIDVDQPRLTDVLLIEHAVKNLQTSIDSILQSSPDNEGLKRMQNSINEETNPQLTAALQRYKMRLGAQLKTMYNEGDLKIFDQILRFEEISDALEAPKSLQFTPHFTTNSSPSSSSSGSFVATKDSGLPPIPEIKDPAIRARVFIHKSLIKDKLFLSKREQLHSHNERLEFLGDSVLNNMMTQIAYHRFPDAAEGYLSVLRTKLISNVTLMKWSAAYGLDKGLKKNTSDGTLNQGKMKLFADVFEAYIGGLMTEDPSNYPVVYDWLKKLAEPILAENEPKKESRSEFRPNAKMELYSLIGTASLGLHYDCVGKDTTSQPQQFMVELRTGAGDLLGKGKAENIKIAGTKAAMQALDDKELIEKYSLIRANTPRGASKLPSQARSKETSKDSSCVSKDTSTSPLPAEKNDKIPNQSRFSKPVGPSPDNGEYGKRDSRGVPSNNRGGRGGFRGNSTRGRGRERTLSDRF